MSSPNPSETDILHSEHEWSDKNQKRAYEFGHVLGRAAGEAFANSLLLEEERFKATHDELTGVLNVAGLKVALKEWEADTRHNPFLVFIDGTNVKAINDKYGHAAGDKAIIDLAEVLKRSVRKGDILARVGGDEFVILTRQDNDNNLVEVNDDDFVAMTDDDFAEISDDDFVAMTDDKFAEISEKAIKTRIAKETHKLLERDPIYDSVGFDIAVGTAQWTGDWDAARSAAEADMMAHKGGQHFKKGQHRQTQPA